MFKHSQKEIISQGDLYLSQIVFRNIIFAYVFEDKLSQFDLSFLTVLFIFYIFFSVTYSAYTFTFHD